MVVRKGYRWVGRAAGQGAGLQQAEGPQGNWLWLPTESRLWWGAAGCSLLVEMYMQHKTVGHL